jgi:hypothetical protein
MRKNSAAVGRRVVVDTDTPGRLASALPAMSAALRPGLGRRGVGERKIAPVDTLGDALDARRRGDERPLKNGSDRICANVGRPVLTPPFFKRKDLTCVVVRPRYSGESIRSRNALNSGTPFLISSRSEFKKKCRSYLYDE